MPLSKVDQNMETAHKRNAVLEEKFYFRKNVMSSTDSDPNVCVPFTMDTIINGKVDLLTQGKKKFNTNLTKLKKGEFPGLLPLVRSYLESMHIDFETRCVFSRYFDLISKRASGSSISIPFSFG